MRKVIEISRKVFIILFLGFAISRFAFAEPEHDALFEKLNQTAVNFRQVTPNLYRSGLISEESVPYLKELGIKTVVTFDNNLKRVEKEQKFLVEAGIKSISIPWSGWDYPNEDTIRKIHEIMNTAQMQPILVHCKHGRERAGVAVATWRIAYQNWSFDQAYQEMKACGFRSTKYGHLREFVSEFAKQHGDSGAETSAFERAKTGIFSFFYNLRKLNPFLREPKQEGVGS